MKRRIMAVCRSSKKMRPKVAAALDRYLWRVGDRTWVGYASTECLERIVADLRRGASRNAAVAIYEQSARVESRRPVLVVGSRTRFSSDGLSPIMTRTAAIAASTQSEEAMRAVLAMAASFHDVGKCTVAFQEKLRRALEGESGQPDPVRHEVWSALFLDACVAQSSGLRAFLDRCRAASLDFDEAAMVAASDIAKLYGEAPPGCPFQDTSPGPLLELRAIEALDEPLLSAVADLVLVHHRLPYFDGKRRFIVSHVNKGDASKLLEKRLVERWPGAPLWSDRKWKRKLAESADRMKALRPDAALPDTATILRSAFMVADHVGSKDSVLLGRPLDDKDLLANTKREDAQPHPADTLAIHTERVRRATFGATKLLSRDRHAMPALSAEEMPDSLRQSTSTEGRFAWQAAAASAARALASSSKGGFFACLMAGTGTGKTRAAPTVLAAAAFADADPARRRLRFVLGLGLRTLAMQSGRDYVDDVGFSERDIAVIIGGNTVRDVNDGFEDEEPSEKTGSLDHLAEMHGLQAKTGQDLFPDRDVFPSDREAQLPPLALQLLQESDGRSGTMRTFLASPIVVTTVDHVMPVADGRRSSHLAAALRVLSGDVVLDEIDQYKEEDLAALSRFGYWVGAGGGRLLVMSATVPTDVAQDIHASYSAGWARHAATANIPCHVHSLVCGDCPESVRTNAGGEAFALLFESAVSHTCARLGETPALRLCETLSVDSADEAPEAIWNALESMHARHAVVIDARRVSVGLVRITRIKDLRPVICSLISRADKPAVQTMFVCLHSRMLRGHRTSIERALKSALTRKGHVPNEGLQAFLRDRAQNLFGDDRIADVRVVVVASPVVETGNDIDFDYAIIDPLSARSVVQTAGRVNRHRCTPVAAPNVAVLSSPLPRLASSRNRLENPGIETVPSRKTGVPECTLAAEATFPGSFVRSGDPSRVDASWTLAHDLQGEITLAEANMRARFRSGCALGTQDFSDSSAYRLSAYFGVRRQFRRSDLPDLEVFLERKNRSLQFLGYPDGRSRHPHTFPARFVLSAFPRLILNLTQDDLEEMIADDGADNVVQLPFAQADTTENLVVDGALGVMTETEARNLRNRS